MFNKNQLHLSTCSFKKFIDRFRVNPIQGLAYVTKILWKLEMAEAYFTCADGTVASIVSKNSFIPRFFNIFT